MADKKIELEIALRDTVSQTLSAVMDQLELMNRKLTHGGQSISESAESIKKLADHTKGVGEDVKDSTKSLLTMHDVLKNMSMLMVGTGPVGIAIGVAATVAAGATAAATAMTSIAKKRLNLRDLRQETGLSEDQLSIMQRAESTLGTKGNTEKIGALLNDLKIRKTGSDLYKGLSDIGQAKFADDLLKMVEGGKMDEAARALIAKHGELNKENIDTARKYAEHALHIPTSFLEGYERASAGLAPAYRVNLEHAEKWAKKMESIMNWSSLVWDRLMERVFRRGAWLLHHADLAHPALPIPTFTPSPESTLAAPEGKSDDTGQLKSEKKEAVKKQKGIGQILHDMLDKAKGTAARQQGGPVQAGQSYVVGEREPELFDSGGQFGLVGQGGPEIIRPEQPGFIEKNLSRLQALELDKKLERKSNETTPGMLGVGLAMKKLAPGPLGLLLDVMAGDPDNVVRSTLRGWGAKAGEYLPDWATRQIVARPFQDDKNEPKPWEASGDWDRKTLEAGKFENRWAGLDQARTGMAQSSVGVKLNASVAFNNVPPGVKTSAEADGMDRFTMARSQPVP